MPIENLRALVMRHEIRGRSLADNRKLAYPRAAMFDLPANGGESSSDLYAELLKAAHAITADEPDAIANMANVAALVWQYVPRLNWAGFYRVIDGGLVLGPFIGKPACIRIASGQGVCGAALASGLTQRIEDVHAFPGHIACDIASRSELVVPVRAITGRIVAVLDLDSPEPARFTPGDSAAIERLVDAIGAALA